MATASTPSRFVSAASAARRRSVGKLHTAPVQALSKIPANRRKPLASAAVGTVALLVAVRFALKAKKSRTSA